MRYYVLLSLLLSAVQSHSTTSVIYGTVNIPGVKTVTIRSNTTLYGEMHNLPNDLQIQLSDEGTYSFEVETTEPFIFSMKADDQWQFVNKYVGPGDSLRIDIAENRLNFDGGDSRHNVFLFAWENRFFLDQPMRNEYNSSWSLMEPSQFLTFWSERRHLQKSFMDSFFNDTPATQKFKEYFQFEVDYDYGVSLLFYFWKGKSSKKAIDMPEFMKAIDEIEFNNSKAVYHGRYQQFLSELPNMLHLVAREKMDSSLPREEDLPLYKFSFACYVIDKNLTGLPAQLATALALKSNYVY
ncbi:MAG: hypothetical protein GC181_07520 [Bacteroidetes bacterium]|nr:hypothetical protein [Bacteroidota bacterium]